MWEAFSWLAEEILGFIIGIISSLTVYFILTFLPIKENVRYRAIFWRRKIAKLILNPSIKVSYTVKTQNLKSKKIEAGDLSKVREKLGQKNFTLKGELGDASIFSHILGKTEVELTLTPSYVGEGNEDEELMVGYLQCNLRLIECKYRNFDGHLLDLIQISRKLETSLEEMVGKWVGESLTCDIKRLYEFVGVLDDLKMGSLTGKIGGQYEIELFENRLVAYGLIETKMTSMIRDIITYYY